MESDEKYIELRFGKKAPFKVPDGYLDNLAHSIMETAMQDGAASYEIKQESADRRDMRLSWWHRCRRYVAVAACAAFAVAGLATYLAVSENEAPVAAHAQHHHAASYGDSQSAGMSASAYDAEMDYTMLDNEDIYSLVASN